MPGAPRNHGTSLDGALAGPLWRLLGALVRARTLLFVVFAAQLSLAACAIPERLIAVPKALSTQALGLPMAEMPHVLYATQQSGCSIA